jgi:hypothetical protein
LTTKAAVLKAVHIGSHCSRFRFQKSPASETQRSLSSCLVKGLVLEMQLWVKRASGEDTLVVGLALLLCFADLG